MLTPYNNNKTIKHREETTMRKKQRQPYKQCDNFKHHKNQTNINTIKPYTIFRQPSQPHTTTEQHIIHNTENTQKEDHRYIHTLDILFNLQTNYKQSQQTHKNTYTTHNNTQYTQCEKTRTAQPNSTTMQHIIQPYTEIMINNIRSTNHTKRLRNIYTHMINTYKMYTPKTFKNQNRRRPYTTIENTIQHIVKAQPLNNIEHNTHTNRTPYNILRKRSNNTYNT